MWQERPCVFHYTSLEAAIESILPEAALRFGLMRSFNDPRDAKRRRLILCGTGDQNHDRLAIWDSWEALTSDGALALATTVDEPTRADPEDPESPYTGHVVGRGFASPAMWAHYGRRHRGVCLVLERDRVEAAVRAAIPEDWHFHVGPIQYDDLPKGLLDATAFDLPNPSDKSESHLREHAIANQQFLFFTKAQAWSYERELRFLVLAAPGASLEVDISAAIRGVVLGEDFPRQYLPSLHKVTQGLLNFEMRQIHWDQGVPTIAPAA